MACVSSLESWKWGPLVQPENGEQSSIDAPLLFRCEMSGQVTESVDIDRTHLLDEDTSR